MKDIDFDELDRAVSSVLGEGSEATPAPAVVETTPPEEPTEVIVSSQPPVEKKSFVEKRSSGRFMDVMHESSDMKKKSQKPPVSRQATTITPPSEEGVPTIVEPEEPATPAVEVATATDEHSFPDPLDFHNFSPDEPSVQDEADTPQEEADDEHELALGRVASELDELNGLIAEDQTPMSVETPFLNGQSIEKRPLGAFSVDTTDTDTSLLSVEVPEESPVETEAPEEVVPPKDDAPQEETTNDEAVTDEREAQTTPEVDVIPEELQDDIVAVEAGEATVATPITGPGLAAGSIQQQYTEKLQPTTSEPTPVFDTTHYHQPLKHTPKQKSGWTTVVIITLFIVAGIGAGAAMYFFDPFGLM